MTGLASIAESSQDANTVAQALWEKVRVFCPTLRPETLRPEFCNGITFHVVASWRARDNGRKQKGSGLLPAQNLRILSPSEASNPSIPGLTPTHLRLRPTSNPMFDVGEFASQPCLIVPIRRMIMSRLEVKRS